MTASRNLPCKANTRPKGPKVELPKADKPLKEPIHLFGGASLPLFSMYALTLSSTEMTKRFTSGSGMAILCLLEPASSAVQVLLEDFADDAVNGLPAPKSL